MIRPAMDHANQVTALIKELLILNRTEWAAATNPPNAEQLEERKCKRKKIRQELVRALSLHKLQREMLVMQNHIEQ
jgi:hypothetical protein